MRRQVIWKRIWAIPLFLWLAIVPAFGMEYSPGSKEGEYPEWIERVDFGEENWPMEFYQKLEEGTDNDGVEDIMIDDHAEERIVVYQSQRPRETPMTADETAEVKSWMQIVYEAFCMDHPEVFWLGSEIQIEDFVEESAGEYTYTFSFILQQGSFDIRSDFYRDATQIRKDIALREEAVDVILSASRSKLIPEQVVELEAALRSRGSAGYTLTTQNCLSALLGSESESIGYAKAFKLLCDRAGIPCVVESGTLVGEFEETEHYWNLVEVAGSWYGVDTTLNKLNDTQYVLVGRDTEDSLIVAWAATFGETHRSQNMIRGLSLTNGPQLAAGSFFMPEIAGIAIIGENQMTVPGLDQTGQDGELRQTLRAVDPGSGKDLSDLVKWSLGTSVSGVSLGRNGNLVITSQARPMLGQQVTVTVSAQYESYVDTFEVELIRAPSMVISLTASADCTELMLPQAGQWQTISLSAIAIDQYGDQFIPKDVVWSLENDEDGIELGSHLGILTVSSQFSEAVKDTRILTVWATYNKIRTSVAITVLRTPDKAVSMEITGGCEALEIPEVTSLNTPVNITAEQPFRVVVKNQYGTVMDVDEVRWSITGMGVSIDQTGLVSVANCAESGSVTITAQWKELCAEQTISLVKPPIYAKFLYITDRNGTILTQDTIEIPRNTSPVEREYQVQCWDQYGDLINHPDIQWSHTAAGGVTFDHAAMLVTKDAQSGTQFTLTAYVHGATASIGITLLAQRLPQGNAWLTSSVPEQITYGDASFTLTACCDGPEGGVWYWSSSDPTVLKIRKNNGSHTVSVDVLGASSTGIVIQATYRKDDYTAQIQTESLLVQPKSVSITGLRVSNKVYDGTCAASFTGDAILQGVLPEDVHQVHIVKGTASFADCTAGTNKKVTFSDFYLAGSGASNYSLPKQPAAVTADILPRTVTISGVTAVDRVFVEDLDTVELNVDNARVHGVLAGDEVYADLSLDAVGKLSDSNVGANQSVTITGIQLAGVDRDNYVLVAQPEAITVTITPAHYAKKSDAVFSASLGKTCVLDLFQLSLPSGSSISIDTISDPDKLLSDDPVIEHGVLRCTLTTDHTKIGKSAEIELIIQHSNYESFPARITIMAVRMESTDGNTDQNEEPEDSDQNQENQKPELEKPPHKDSSDFKNDASLWEWLPNGDLVQTIQYEDGTTTTFTLHQNGTISEITIYADGSVSTRETMTDGSVILQFVEADGTIIVSHIEESGTNTVLTLSQEQLTKAWNNKESLLLPIEAWPVFYPWETSDYLTIYTLSAKPVQIAIPVERDGAGIVAIRVNQDGTESIIPDSIAKDGVMTLTVCNGVTIKIIDHTPFFLSNPECNLWITEAAIFASARGWLLQNDSNLFEPDAPFTTTDLSHIFGPVVEQLNLVPTRENLILLLWKLAGCPESELVLSCHDCDQIASDAMTAMQWAVEKGILQGMGDGSMAPKNIATCAQTALILYRYLAISRA